MKNTVRGCKLISVFFIGLLLITGCGGGEGVNDRTSQTETQNGNETVRISGTLSDTSTLFKTGPGKLTSESRRFYLRGVGTWANAVIQAIDSLGVVIATTNSDSNGNYLLSVPPGSNYFLKASLGNLVLKAFVENATLDLSNTVIDPASAATVKILCQVIGNPAGGEPGVDVSLGFTQYYTASTLSTINSNTNFPEIVTAITEEIATSYDPLGTVPGVGSGGTAGIVLISQVAGDTAPPVLTAGGPPGGATGISLNTTVTATFSEEMAVESITNSTFTVSGNAGNVRGSVTYALGTATFTPQVDLSHGVTYTATIRSSVTDTSGNPLAADYSWTFTTVPGAPAVSGTAPLNNATGVAINTSMTANFTTAMTQGGFTPATFTVSDGAANIPGSVSYYDTVATFNPPASLQPGTVYTATISGNVTDLAGNLMGADYIWTFTTGANSDITPPSVTGTSPLALAGNVAVDSVISVTFSEAMAPAGFTSTTFTLNDGTGNVVGAFATNGLTTTFTPSSLLSANTTYTATVSASVTDLAANPLGAVYTWSFTTNDPGALVTEVIFPDINLKNCILSSGKTYASQVKSLNCSQKNITDLTGIGNFTGLTRLNMNDNQLPTLPLEIGNLTALTYLTLNNNLLSSLPTQLGNLTALTQLYLHSNKLPGLPAGMGNLTALTSLGVTKNLLTVIPAEIGNLTSLTVLDLRFNLLSGLPVEIGNLTALTVIRLSNNQLAGLPAGIGNFTALTSLDLSHNQLTALPTQLGNLAKLTSLTLTNNQLGSLPTQLGNLIALKSLDVAHNQLTALPVEIGNLSALDSLALNNNLLAALPVEIGNLTALTDLDLTFNQLTTLPVEIGNLAALTGLGLSSNQLTTVPPEAGALSALSYLNLYSNQLTGLPIELGNLSALNTLNLLNNDALPCADITNLVNLLGDNVVLQPTLCIP